MKISGVTKMNKFKSQQVTELKLKSVIQIIETQELKWLGNIVGTTWGLLHGLRNSFKLFQNYNLRMYG